jgi:hypothetical protein
MFIENEIRLNVPQFKTNQVVQSDLNSILYQL